MLATVSSVSAVSALLSAVSSVSAAVTSLSAAVTTAVASVTSLLASIASVASVLGSGHGHDDQSGEYDKLIERIGLARIRLVERKSRWQRQPSSSHLS